MCILPAEAMGQARMNAKALQALELHKVLDQLAEHCSFSAGAQLAREQVPTSDFDEAMQQRILGILSSKNDRYAVSGNAWQNVFPTHIRDYQDWWARVQAASAQLSASVFLDDPRQFTRGRDGAGPGYPGFSRLAAAAALAAALVAVVVFAARHFHGFVLCPAPGADRGLECL